MASQPQRLLERGAFTLSPAKSLASNGKVDDKRNKADVGWEKKVAYRKRKLQLQATVARMATESSMRAYVPTLRVTSLTVLRD